MAIESRILLLPKRGHTADEYEDRARGDDARGRFAIADGAAQSSYAELWAEMLVAGFVESNSRWPTEQKAWLSELQPRWRDRLNEVIANPLPYYARNKLAKGAFATFLGLIVEPETADARNRWRAFSVGDSCLFHTRNGRLRKAFPIRDANAFGNTPALVGTRMSPEGILDRTRGRWRLGRWLAGDRFWLMTDALSRWFLERCQAGEKPWEALEQFAAPGSQGRFEMWIEALRDRDELRNDDVTLLVVSL